MRLAEAVLRWSAGRKRNREDHRISKLAKEFTPSCPFGVKHIIESKLTIEGAGVKLRRAFATSRARPATMTSASPGFNSACMKTLGKARAARALPAIISK
jgi:hypothetical protein